MLCRYLSIFIIIHNNHQFHEIYRLRVADLKVSFFSVSDSLCQKMFFFISSLALLRWAQENESSGKVQLTHFHHTNVKNWISDFDYFFFCLSQNEKCVAIIMLSSPMIPQFALMINCEAITASRKYFKLAIIYYDTLIHNTYRV